MSPLRFCVPLFLAASPCLAAVSILVEPGTTSSTTFFTVTQTSPSPLLAIAGLAGYSSGMSLPAAMFIVDAGEGVSSDIYGGLGTSVATITESISGQTFSLSGIRISVDPSLPSLLGFDRLFTLPTGYSLIQFEAATAGRVETSIPAFVLNPGTYSVGDTIFGEITVTVIPEPSSLALPGIPALLALCRRRRN